MQEETEALRDYKDTFDEVCKWGMKGHRSRNSIFHHHYSPYRCILVLVDTWIGKQIIIELINRKTLLKFLS